MGKEDFDVSDHLDEVSDEDLIREMASRGFDVYEGNECVSNEDVKNLRERMPSEYRLKRCFDARDLRAHLENITGAGHFYSKEDLLNKIKELL